MWGVTTFHTHFRFIFNLHAGEDSTTELLKPLCETWELFESRSKNKVWQLLLCLKLSRTKGRIAKLQKHNYGRELTRALTILSSCWYMKSNFRAILKIDSAFRFAVPDSEVWK